MLDGLSPMDWIFLVAALALGFGVVKFMLAHHAGGQDRPPTSQQPPDSTGTADTGRPEQDGAGRS